MVLVLFHRDSIWWELSDVGGDDAPLEGYRNSVPIDTLEDQHVHPSKTTASCFALLVKTMRECVWTAVRH